MGAWEHGGMGAWEHGSMGAWEKLTVYFPPLPTLPPLPTKNTQANDLLAWAS